MNAAVQDAKAFAANDGYYLTPDKAKDKRRIANVRAKNAANARIFMVDGIPMTVKRIAEEAHSNQGRVSKEIKRMRGRGITRFTMTQFQVQEAANDDAAEG